MGLPQQKIRNAALFSSSTKSRHGFTIFWIIHGNDSIDIGGLNWLEISMVKYSKPG
jgi:hypothetical protein